MIEPLITAFPTHPVVVAFIALGAVAGASTVIWKLWIKPMIDAVKGAIGTAQEIVALLRDIRDFFTLELPTLKGQVEDIASSLEQHIEQEDARLGALERKQTA